MRRLRAVAASAIAFALCGTCATAHAGTAIYLSTTSTGMPSYSHEPDGSGTAPYLVLSEPPPRPRQPRIDSPRLVPRMALARAFDAVVDPTIDNLVAAASRAYDVPEALILAVMHAESRFDPAARSAVGAVGLMQIMPPTGARYGVALGLADPVNNIDVGTRYLKDLLALFGGNKELAVAAYNAGEGAVLRHGGRIPPYAETRAYVPRVMSLYARYADGPRRVFPSRQSTRN